MLTRFPGCRVPQQPAQPRPSTSSQSARRRGRAETLLALALYRDASARPDFAYNQCTVHATTMTVTALVKRHVYHQGLATLHPRRCALSQLPRAIDCVRLRTLHDVQPHTYMENHDRCAGQSSQVSSWLFCRCGHGGGVPGRKNERKKLARRVLDYLLRRLWVAAPSGLVLAFSFSFLVSSSCSYELVRSKNGDGTMYRTVDSGMLTRSQQSPCTTKCRVELTR